MKCFEKKSFGFGEKFFDSDTDTEIEPWFQFPIPKPGFGHTLLCCIMYCKVASTSPSRLEAHAGVLRLSMKRKFDVYLL